MSNYDHKKIESKWQKKWATSKLYKTEENSKKEKCYVLDMFPYPSGEGLHVGHPKGYIATDIYSRWKRMSGFEVLHPMGWDAFGLPAENFAIKNKTHPRKAVEKNIKRYKEQLSIIGLDYDWSREINTTDPAYYKWTQWIFLKLYEKGLAYQSFEPINWCPSCQTGLANEDLENGKCERCGSVVEKKPMRQWLLKITDYAERLLTDLKDLDWPESIKESERHWIGKSEGAEIDFDLKISVADASLGVGAGEKSTTRKSVKVFTTRPDTIFGVTYLVLAPEHSLVSEILPNISNRSEVEKYLVAAKAKTEIDRTTESKEKTGVKLGGITATNPANQEEIPVFIADYVLASYGTGAIMAVPAHDERDFHFAKKYGLPVIDTVMPVRIDKNNPPVAGKKTVERRTVHALIRRPRDGKFLCLKWKKQPWTGFVVGGVDENEDIVEAARREAKEETGYSNLKLIKVLGSPVRAEYFAAHKDENRLAFTTPIFFELTSEEMTEVSGEEQEKHEIVWLSKEEIQKGPFTCAELDIWMDRLSGNETYSNEGLMVNSGKFNGLKNDEAKNSIIEFVGGKIVTKYKLRDWVFSRQRYWGEPIPIIHCEKCGVVPVPEKDLPVKLPEVKNYQPAGTGESPLAAIEKWVNVKCPKCRGTARRETNTMPQWAGSSWYYLRFMDSKNRHELVNSKKEKYWAPVDVYVGGAEHATRHLIYARFWHKFLYDIGVVSTIEPFKKLHNVGLILAEDGKKMSKRYGNVINPDDVIKTYGADTLRVYEMFMGPFGQSTSWDTKSIMGSERFVERIFRVGERAVVSKKAKNSFKPSDVLLSSLNKTIKKVSDDIHNFNFNTAISSLMIFSRELEQEENLDMSVVESFIKICAPFTPHVCEEIWNNLGNKKSVHASPWPTFDEKLLEEKTAVIAIQINGKLRDQITVAVDLDEIAVRNIAMDREEVKKWLDGKEIRRVVYVKGRILNIVV